MEGNYPDPIPVSKIQWHIERKGKPFINARQRYYDLAPEKIEMIGGKLFWTERDRLVMLGLLLENVGVDKAVRLGNPQVWREALAHLDEALDLDKEEKLGLV